ncbi:MAG TPA: DUF4302 domain-containing protein, partial [Flavitalea sp.]|nr:DUF4302 domain-containing protein [Flavitalea sp.]
GIPSLDVEVGGLTYYVTFPDSNRTVMVSDFNVETANVPKESGWHLKATQRPSLVFDTYSYIHIAADPDETVSFSPSQQGGYGWGSDFDFSFLQAEPGDTLFLDGNFNHSSALMIKATQEEIDAAFSGQLKHIVEVTKNLPSTTSFLYFNATDNTKIGIAFNTFLFRLNFVYLSSGELQTVSVPYSHTTYGVHFKAPVTVGGYTFQDLYWDDALDLYYINTGSGRVNIENSNTPLIPMNVVLGKYVVNISVPTTPLEGQSAKFASAYEDVKSNLKSSGFNLDLKNIDFIFDDGSKTMSMLINVEQDGNPFIAAYVYDYTALSSSNVTKFTRSLTNGNGNLVEADVKPLLDYIEQDNFRVDYYTGVTPPLGQFTSIQNPDFFFTGNIE